MLAKRVRALGIDFGEKRIGLALSDPDGRWAYPWKVIERRTDRRALYEIADLVRQEEVGMLVVGEPLAVVAAAPASPTAARARRFGERLAKITGLPVRWVDETLTTVEATERLQRADPRRGPRRGRRSDDRVDAVAAQILLQEMLDREQETHRGRRP